MKKFLISQLRNEFQRVQKTMKILVARTLNKIVLVLIFTPSLAVDARSLGPGPESRPRTADSLLVRSGRPCTYWLEQPGEINRNH